MNKVLESICNNNELLPIGRSHQIAAHEVCHLGRNRHLNFRNGPFRTQDNEVKGKICRMWYCVMWVLPAAHEIPLKALFELIVNSLFHWFSNSIWSNLNLFYVNRVTPTSPNFSD